jgi:hypothetical protein
MKRSSLPRFGVLICTFACLLAAGCGARKVKVHGKLTEGPLPVKGAERQPIVVTFCPYNGEGKADGTPYTAEVDQENGNYEVIVPVGQHRICISRFQADLSDRFDGAFAQGQSPILRDVNDEAAIDLDLSQFARRSARGVGNVPMPKTPP